MNSIVKITLLSLIYISCGSSVNKAKSNEIYFQDAGNYSISISTIDTKFDKNGKAQCSKFVRVKKSDSLYTSYGLSLTEVFAAALFTTPKYIESDIVNDLKNKYFDIKIINKNKSELEYTDVISKHLSLALKLKIDTFNRVVNGYSLVISDSSKLQLKENECLGELTKYDKGVFSTESSNLKGVTKIIDRYSDYYVNFETPNNQCYSLKFRVGNNVKKVNELLNKSGLKLEESKFSQEFFELTPIND